MDEEMGTSSCEKPHSDVTTVDGKEYLTICGTNLMDYVVADDIIESASLEIYREETLGLQRFNSSHREKICTSIMESKQMRDILRHDLLQGVYSSKTIVTDLGLNTSIDDSSNVLETTIVQIVQTMIKTAMDGLNIEHYTFLFPFVTYSHFNLLCLQEFCEKSLSEGYKHWISIKLDSFYDNIPHDLLLQKLRILFQDDRVYELAKRLVISGSMDMNNPATTNGILKDCPFAYLIGPVVYLVELDAALYKCKPLSKTNRNKTLNIFGCNQNYVRRWNDEIVVFCESEESAEHAKREIVSYIENIIKCPVDLASSRTGTEEYLSVFGMEMKHGEWFISEARKQDAYTKFHDKLIEYSQAQDERILFDACEEMSRFIKYYLAVPSFVDEADELWERCLKEWAEFASPSRELFFQWLHIPHDMYEEEYEEEEEEDE